VAAYDNGLFDVDGDGPLLEQSIVCYDTAEQEVFARQGGVTKLPNAFTPSPNGPNGGIPDDTGGSFNDVFLPITRGVEEFEMQIFDRWGNLIFVSHDKGIGWDGYDRNGHLLPAGVYVFKLTLRLSDQQRTTQIGDVTLIR
jgi:gliding motility-associated-like protein